jgi:hypothetical protein
MTQRARETLRVARRRRAERFYACGALEPLRAARSTRTLDVDSEAVCWPCISYFVFWFY